MADLISRSAALNVLLMSTDYRDAHDMLEQLPTVDAVTVIRCRNCKYYNPENCGEGCGWCERNGMGHGSFDDWFCADGESKENTELTDAIKEAGE